MPNYRVDSRLERRNYSIADIPERPVVAEIATYQRVKNSGKPGRAQKRLGSEKLAAALPEQTFDHIPNRNELAPRSSRGKWDIQSLR